jgi:AraC-like DNA-binding protein
MVQSFSTDLVPVADRLDAWLCNARQICGDCQFQFHKRFPFHGSIERRRVVGLELTLFSSSALSFSKFPPSDVRPENRACIVITQLAGIRQYNQAGKIAVLSKGDTTLIDSGLPWTSNCSGDCARLYLRIPLPLLQRRLRNLQVPIAARIWGTRGIGATLFHLITSLYQQADHLNEEEGAAAIDAYLGMLSTCIGGAPAKLTKKESTSTSVSGILRYIDQHLNEASLSPAEIASATGISVRHLHRVFSGQGSTVNNWIRTQRLKHCREELSEPCSPAKSITEIALDWGFNDSAHFSHCFKKQFGISPRDARSCPFRGPQPTGKAAIPYARVAELARPKFG